MAESVIVKIRPDWGESGKDSVSTIVFKNQVE